MLNFTSGNINSFADSAGERLAGRDGTVPQSASGERSTTVAENGTSEFKQGLAALKGENRNTTTATTNTGAPPINAAAEYPVTNAGATTNAPGSVRQPEFGQAHEGAVPSTVGTGNQYPSQPQPPLGQTGQGLANPSAIQPQGQMGVGQYVEPGVQQKVPRNFVDGNAPHSLPPPSHP